MAAGKTFRDREKERYQKLPLQLFDSGVAFNGNYRGTQRSFCLSDSNIGVNLYQDLRVSAMEYFARRGIPWHDGLIERQVPSNHLCCSQSCCVNFLYPMMNDGRLLTSVFKEFYPDMVEALPIEEDRHKKDKTAPFLVFEWIGTRDYLNEQRRKGIQRTRGANYTSADFMFRFRSRSHGKEKIHLVLGEWKYTEDYRQEDKGTNKTRKQNYAAAFSRNKGVFNQPNEVLYNSLFFEPFYQLMRLQLMGQEMEQQRELEAEEVSVLHICPKGNNDFRDNVTSPTLSEMFPGLGVLDIWKKLVVTDKFKSKSVEELLKAIITNKDITESSWVEYLRQRYGW